LFRTNARAEDVLSVTAAIVLVMFLGVKAAGFQLTEENYGDIAFILSPVALLIFVSSFRYAFRPLGTPAIREVTSRTGRILRDWSPFLFFSMLYESFQGATWQLFSPADKDPLLLRWDIRLFGQTPSVPLDRWIRPELTQVLTIAYFLHLVLPPVIALIWYRSDLLVFRQFLLAILVSAIIASQGYVLVPAVGPAIAFPSLYRHTLTGATYEAVTSLIDSARAPRDVFPSLHVGISSIVLWYAWRHGRPLFIITLPLVFANWLSTLYLRYHYMVDVIAGWLTAVASILLSTWILRLEAWLKREPASPGSAH